MNRNAHWIHLATDSNTWHALETKFIEYMTHESTNNEPSNINTTNAHDTDHTATTTDNAVVNFENEVTNVD